MYKYLEIDLNWRCLKLRWYKSGTIFSRCSQHQFYWDYKWRRSAGQWSTELKRKLHQCSVYLITTNGKCYFFSTIQRNVCVFWNLGWDHQYFDGLHFCLWPRTRLSIFCLANGSFAGWSSICCVVLHLRTDCEFSLCQEGYCLTSPWLTSMAFICCLFHGFLWLLSTGKTEPF